ncbi:hypothetical protein ACJMK2_035666, partial [Sinanodonta woodiana]
SGQMSVIQGLNYESAKQYKVRVDVTDDALDLRTGTTTVTINVVDVQDEIPVFVDIAVSVSVNENQGSNSFVVAVTAVDPDSTSNVQFVLLGTDAASFSISQALIQQGHIGVVGNIYTNINLDYETKSSYQFYVTTADAKNSGTSMVSATATVFVTVNDLNEFSPVLSVANQVLSFADITASGTVLTVVTANDNDDRIGLPNHGVTFSISNIFPSSGTGLFYVHHTDGRLFLVDSFTKDVSQPSQYT